MSILTEEEDEGEGEEGFVVDSTSGEVARGEQDER